MAGVVPDSGPGRQILSPPIRMAGEREGERGWFPGDRPTTPIYPRYPRSIPRTVGPASIRGMSDPLAVAASPARVVHIHLVSDATGETIYRVARACLVQFAGIEAH